MKGTRGLLCRPGPRGLLLEWKVIFWAEGGGWEMEGEMQSGCPGPTRVTRQLGPTVTRPCLAPDLLQHPGPVPAGAVRVPVHADRPQLVQLLLRPSAAQGEPEGALWGSELSAGAGALRWGWGSQSQLPASHVALPRWLFWTLGQLGNLTGPSLTSTSR